MEVYKQWKEKMSISTETLVVQALKKEFHDDYKNLQEEVKIKAVKHVKKSTKQKQRVIFVSWKEHVKRFSLKSRHASQKLQTFMMQPDSRTMIQKNKQQVFEQIQKDVAKEEAKKIHNELKQRQESWLRYIKENQVSSDHQMSEQDMNQLAETMALYSWWEEIDQYGEDVNTGVKLTALIKDKVRWFIQYIDHIVRWDVSDVYYPSWDYIDSFHSKKFIDSLLSWWWNDDISHLDIDASSWQYACKVHLHYKKWIEQDKKTKKMLQWMHRKYNDYTWKDGRIDHQKIHNDFIKWIKKRYQQLSLRWWALAHITCLEKGFWYSYDAVDQDPEHIYQQITLSSDKNALFSWSSYSSSYMVHGVWCKYSVDKNWHLFLSDVLWKHMEWNIKQQFDTWITLPMVPTLFDKDYKFDDDTFEKFDTWDAFNHFMEWKILNQVGEYQESIYPDDQKRIYQHIQKQKMETTLFSLCNAKTKDSLWWDIDFSHAVSINMNSNKDGYQLYWLLQRWCGKEPWSLQNMYTYEMINKVILNTKFIEVLQYASSQQQEEGAIINQFLQAQDMFNISLSENQIKTKWEDIYFLLTNSSLQIDQLYENIFLDWNIWDWTRERI